MAERLADPERPPRLARPAVGPRRFAAFRLLLGLWAFVFFARLVPYGKELFSDEGMFPVAPSFSRLPNVLTVAEGPAAITAVLVALCAASALLMAGWARPVCCGLLWYGLACLVGRNPGVSNPALPFLGWLLLATALVPAGEPWRLGRRAAQPHGWEMPRVLFFGAWAILALGYSLSGLDKLTSPGWVEGTALASTLELPYARIGGVAEMLRAAPSAVTRTLCWGVLATELLFAPLALFRRTRMWIWAAGAALHISLLAVFAFPELSTGMLLAHLFTFDERWLERGRS